MARLVEKELLDDLAVNDAGAIGSRRDLWRLNWWMGHGRIMARALGLAVDGEAPGRIIELGAGDGEFALGLGRRLSGLWPSAGLMLVDQHDAVVAQTRRTFATLPWRVEYVTADVFDWARLQLEQRTADRGDVIIANLFLHHFADARLAELLRAVARLARAFVALEPRRSRWALAASRQLWAIGCNQVTRHDAPVSVRAGFAGQELSRLWPANGEWQLAEQRAGWFSHLFVARRRT